MQSYKKNSWDLHFFYSFNASIFIMILYTTCVEIYSIFLVKKIFGGQSSDFRQGRPKNVYTPHPIKFYPGFKLFIALVYNTDVERSTLFSLLSQQCLEIAKEKECEF